MSSAAASPAARPPGKSRAPAFRSSCTRCARARHRGAPDRRLAELVCSNSFRSDDAENNAVGVIHREMRAMGSLIMRWPTRIRFRPAAPWRSTATAFPRRSRRRSRRSAHSHRARGSRGVPPEDWDSVIVATGPLTSPAFAAAIRAVTGEEALAFFDAIAPIVHRDSIDMDSAWMQSRYDKSGPGGTGADYINCPLDRAQYEASSTRCWRPRRPSSRNSRTRPISMAACRSK